MLLAGEITLMDWKNNWVEKVEWDSAKQVIQSASTITSYRRGELIKRLRRNRGVKLL